MTHTNFLKNMLKEKYATKLAEDSLGSHRDL